MMPGETALARMPRFAYSMASERVAAARPPLVSEANTDGTLGTARRTRYRTDVFAQYDAQADGEIAKIIKENEMASAATAAQPSAQHVAAREHKGNAG